MRFFIILMLFALYVKAQDTTISQTQPLGIAKIIKVYDGDTFYADLYALPNVFGKNLGIRLTGINTAELTGSDSCNKALAKSAKIFLEQVLKNACHIELREVTRDKYFRLDAVVYADTINVNQLMIQKGFAKPYTGEGPKPTFTCTK